jgi:hypothetical protein
MLIDAGLSVERHFDHFLDNTKDEEWLAEVGCRGWYAITHDRRIRSKPNEKAAVFKANVGLFVVIGKAPLPQLAENFIATFPKIKQFIEKHPAPFIAKVYRPDGKTGELIHTQSGRVEMWESYKSG